ncbi:hypothetical protein BKA64DRAFT_684065 [Cadophora sp. MPI-SDFR-AT-0126]|nr:hypothetical protein BKA64DRAFT_684065 [Leotiomycetes sp. MPI-SDFR-AT-0126]
MIAGKQPPNMAEPTVTAVTVTTITSPKPKKSSTSRIILTVLAIVAIFGFILLTTFLATDLFYIPYLSEFSKFLVLLISPIVPLFFPFFLGVFLKVCQHKTWPRKKVWIFITGSWVFQHLQRAVTDAIALYHGGDVCGLSECKGKWVEWSLVVGIVLCQIGGRKWDAGYVDRWIDGLIQREAQAEAQKRAEKGEMPDRSDLEKADKFEGVVYADANEEKRELKARDEMVVEVNQEVLVVVDEQNA